MTEDGQSYTIVGNQNSDELPAFMYDIIANARTVYIDLPADIEVDYNRIVQLNDQIDISIRTPR